MKIVLAGGSGYLGRPLASRLGLSGHEVVVLTRSQALGRAAGGVRFVTWNPDATTTDPAASTGHHWWRELDGADAVVNLAGQDLAEMRWTTARKHVLRESRIHTTRMLVAAMVDAPRPPKVFVQQSAIGYYGSRGDEVVDESSGPGLDFLAELCVDWEAEGRQAAVTGCRLVIVRTGIVLSADGGALKKLLLPFRMFVGGPVGSGRQYWSWIHRDDWVAMMAWLIETPEVEGIVNATAPKPVTNKVFVRALGRALHRPSLIPVPGFVLRTLVGEVADVALLAGQRVLPRRALELKFGFRYPDIDLAMKAAIAPTL